MSNKILKTVNVRHPKTLHVVTLNPGDDVPDWAYEVIKNPAVIGTIQALEPDPEPVAPKRADVLARAKELGVNGKGKTEEILARIAEAENAPVELTRAELEAKATEAGLTFTSETTDAELEALLDD